jgi:hypothetical protein
MDRNKENKQGSNQEVLFHNENFLVALTREAFQHPPFYQGFKLLN